MRLAQGRIACIAIAVLILCSVHSFAGTIQVTTLNDELNNDSDCSLREAVQAANTNSPVSGCDAGDAGLDIIKLGSGTYSLTLPGKNEDNNATGDLDILESLEIIGNGAIISDGVSQPGVMGDGIRLIHVDPPNVGGVDLTMSGVSLHNADLGCASFNCENGAAVIHFQADGHLVFENGNILNNTVSCTGGNCGSAFTQNSQLVGTNFGTDDPLDYDTDNATFGSAWIVFFGGDLTFRNVRFEGNLATCNSTNCFAGIGIDARQSGALDTNLTLHKFHYVDNRITCTGPNNTFCSAGEMISVNGGGDASITNSTFLDNVNECYGTDCDNDEFLELDIGSDFQNILFQNVELRNNTLFCRGNDCDSDEFLPGSYEVDFTMIDVVIEGNTLKCEGIDCDADELIEYSESGTNTTNLYRNVRVLNNISTCTGEGCGADEISDSSFDQSTWENTEWINNETSCFGDWCSVTDIWDDPRSGSEDSFIRDSIFINNRIICDGQDCNDNADIFDNSSGPGDLIHENIVVIGNRSECRNNTNCRTSNNLFDNGDNMIIRNSTIADNHVDFSLNLFQMDTDFIMEKSAIVGNTGGPGGIVVNEPGSTLINNWWGCNEGPNMPGCDTANAGATFDPWLIMTLEISPNPVRVGDVARTIGTLSDPGALASVHFFTNSNGETIPNLIQRPVGYVIDQPAMISGLSGSANSVLLGILSLLVVGGLAVRNWQPLRRLGGRRVATAFLIMIFAAVGLTGCGLGNIPAQNATVISFGGIAQVTITSNIPGQVTLTASADNETITESVFFIP